MKRIFKTALCSLLCICVLVSILIFSVSAAGTVIAFSKNSLTVGETLTVTVTISSDSELYGVSCIINYNDTVLSYASGSATGGAGSLKIVESPSGEKKVSYSLKFTALKAGSSTISVVSCEGSVMGSNGATIVPINGVSDTATVKDAALSANANLKSLSVSKGKLSPAFSASRKTYTVTVDNSVTECKIYATAADKDAKVEVSGENTLDIGLNTRVITITAPDGTQNQYTVKITRKEKASDTSSENDSSSEGTESDETTSSDTETPNENPLSTNIDGAPYTVIENISEINLFNGFTAQKIEYNGTQIDVAVDSENNFTIYYLLSDEGGEPVPYTYDTDEDTFTKVQYMTQLENTYIFTKIPDDMTVSDSYYKTNATINGFSVDCYASSNSSLSDFYYIYCFTDGRFGMYRYDNRENVMQRYPEFGLLEMSDTNTDNNGKETILDRFSALSSNARTIVISLVLIAVGAIALIVLIVLRFARSKADIDQDYDDGDFDSFSLVVNSSSQSETEENDQETEE